MLFSVVVRWRLRELPLERDEGEFAYAGQLILENVPPYQLAYNMKLPGTYLAYAGLMAVLGQTTAGIHLGLLAVNVATLVLLFLMVKDMFDPLAGGLAAVVFSLLATSPSVLGLAAHATHFVVFFSLPGVWLLWRSLQAGRKGPSFSAGLLLGTAFLMKQQAVFLLCFGGSVLLVHELRRRPIAWRQLLTCPALYAAGVMMPYALVCLWLWRAGVFGRFWFWTVDYARQYVDQIPPSLAWEVFKINAATVVSPNWTLWATAAVGVIAVAVGSGQKPALRGFVLGWLTFSFLCVCPGFYFRNHYFIVLLPAVAALAGVGASAALPLAARLPGFSVPVLAAAPQPAPRASAGFWVWPVGLLLAGVLLLPLWEQGGFYFLITPAAACRQVYGLNPFLECPVIAEYLRKNTTPKQTIAVLGSEPEVFFDARRKSATGYIYTYGLMEVHPFAQQMQEEMGNEIEAAKPEFIVFVDVPVSWLPRPNSRRYILKWASRYLRQSYRPVGIVELSPQGSEYHWGEQAAAYRPPPPRDDRHPFRLIVFRRKPVHAGDSS